MPATFEQETSLPLSKEQIPLVSTPFSQSGQKQCTTSMLSTSATLTSPSTAGHDQNLFSGSTATLLNILTSSSIPKKQTEKLSGTGTSLKMYFKSSSTRSSQTEVDQIQPDSSLPMDTSDFSHEDHFTSSPISIPSDSSDSLDHDELTYFHEDTESTPGDESSSLHSLTTESDNEKENCIQVLSHSESSHPLPFPDISCEWYEKQRALEVHNAAREELRRSKAMLSDYKGNISFVDRSQTKGELSQNIQTLTGIS